MDTRSGTAQPTIGRSVKENFEQFLDGFAPRAAHGKPLCEFVGGACRRVVATPGVLEFLVA
jgi:hypothetical protein